MSPDPDPGRIPREVLGIPYWKVGGGGCGSRAVHGLGPLASAWYGAWHGPRWYFYPRDLHSPTSLTPHTDSDTVSVRRRSSPVGVGGVSPESIFSDPHLCDS